LAAASSSTSLRTTACILWSSCGSAGAAVAYHASEAPLQPLQLASAARLGGRLRRGQAQRDLQIDQQGFARFEAASERVGVQAFGRRRLLRHQLETRAIFVLAQRVDAPLRLLLQLARTPVRVVGRFADARLGDIPVGAKLRQRALDFARVGARQRGGERIQQHLARLRTLLALCKLLGALGVAACSLPRASRSDPASSRQRSCNALASVVARRRSGISRSASAAAISCSRRWTSVLRTVSTRWSILPISVSRRLRSRRSSREPACGAARHWISIC
jgi:hypothetical protein